jgi:signal transduction histidine kinase
VLYNELYDYDIYCILPCNNISFIFRIVISTKVENDELSISVRDNGVGMTKDKIERIFRIEENSSTPGTQNEKGTGLGLILCKEFIQKHGGKIFVKSEIGKGSVFSFTIPYKP